MPPKAPEEVHPKPHHREGARNGAPKRVTTPAGITIVGAEALGSHPENIRTAPDNSDATDPESGQSGLHHMIWELSKLEHLQHQDP